MKFPSVPQPASAGRKWDGCAVLTVLAGAYAVAGGFLTLAGWALEIPRLTDWAGRGISMFPNAAMCAIAGGCVLLLEVVGIAGKARLVTQRVLGGFCALVGGLTLFQHASGLNLGIDKLLFAREWGQAVSTAPMRIGVPASTAYLVLGIGFFLLTWGTAARKVASGAAVFAVAIASLSLTGYWFGANQLFGVARFTGISWQTAAIIAGLGIGLLAALPEHGLPSLLRRKDAGGEVARRLLLPIIAIPLLLGWLRLVGENAGLFDQAFGTAVRSLLEILLFLALLWWTAESISRHAVAAENAEAALRHSEARFVRFMQSLPGLAWIKDLKGRYVYANDAAARAFGRPPEAFYGRTDADIFPTETAEKFMNNDRAALAGGGAGLQVIETLEQSGGVHFSLVSKFPIPGPDGAPALIGGMAIDITDRMKAEEALREADRRKDEFLATLAHELRNPLAPIRMTVQLLKAKGAGDAESQWALDVVDRQVQQMVRLLEDLLDVSRISYGKLALRLERVELAAVIHRAVETSRPFINEGRHLLELHLPPGPVFLNADPVRLAQVFSNLLNNAAKFTPKNGRIEITAQVVGTEVEIAVRDNGPGISAGKLGSIFEIFSQGDRSGHAHGGLGIGLALVKGLLELHRGHIEARSEGPGRGSEFIVRLPLAAVPEPPDAEADGKEAPLHSQKKWRILVADDLRDNADSVALFLTALGHEVHTAYDGREAVQLAEQSRPEILFLDIGMPKMDGNDVCRRIREQDWGRRTVIVAVTGWGQEADRRKTAAAGFDHHLVKPVDPGLLVKLLDDLA